MRFLRRVTGYTRLDEIRSEVIRKELAMSATQDLRFKYKQNCINHVERTDNTRLPKHALNYKPRGRRDRGRPQETMAVGRCRNRSNDLIHGGRRWWRWWWWWLDLRESNRVRVKITQWMPSCFPLLTKYSSGNEIMTCTMGWTCCTYRGKSKLIVFWWENLNGRDHVEGLGVWRIIILKLT